MKAVQITPLRFTHVEQEQEFPSQRGCEGCRAYEITRNANRLIYDATANRVSTRQSQLELGERLFQQGNQQCEELRRSKACVVDNPPPAPQYHFHLDPEATTLLLEHLSGSQLSPIIDSDPRRLR